MRTRTLILLIVMAFVAAFVALNWPVFMALAPLNLGFTAVQAPVGLVMLGLAALVAIGSMAYLAVLSGSALADARRHTRELQSQRALAEQAEASRLVELRTSTQDGIERLERRLGQVEDTLRTEIHAQVNSLAAMLGELSDRVPRPGRD